MILLGLLLTYEIGPPHHFAQGSLLACADFRAAVIFSSLTKSPRRTIPGGLDVVGDLALTGCDIVADVVAFRSGHRLHAEFAQRLLEQIGVTRDDALRETRLCA